MRIFKSPRGQAMPGPTRPMTGADFAPRPDTAVTWLGSAGMLQDFDMPLLIQPPILPRQVPQLDALLITHIDNDHFSRSGCVDLKEVCRSYHAPRYVAEQISALGLPGTGHGIGETFRVGCVSATLTPAKHDWQNSLLDFSDNEWHITFEGAVKLAEAYPQARLLCIHWGSVDAPDWSTFNGDPAALAARVSNPERLLAPAPGESIVL